MKTGKHTDFMIDFITRFTGGEIDRFFFDLDYSAYVIEHYPYMERENPTLADRFASIVDRAYEDGSGRDISDENFRELISSAMKAWLK